MRLILVRKRRRRVVGVADEIAVPILHRALPDPPCSPAVHELLAWHEVEGVVAEPWKGRMTSRAPKAISISHEIALADRADEVGRHHPGTSGQHAALLRLAGRAASCKEESKYRRRRRAAATAHDFTATTCRSARMRPGRAATCLRGRTGALCCGIFGCKFAKCSVR